MQNEVYVIGATRITVGLSAIVAIKPTDYQTAETIKIFSGGGTLEIVPVPLALSGSSCTGWGNGWPIGASEVYSVGGPAVFYLAATGATMVACMTIGRSAGATCL